jgi:hypothetical protein
LAEIQEEQMIDSLNQSRSSNLVPEDCRLRQRCPTPQ